eukprot:1750139-Rhodomonas_salina.2
MAQLDDLHYTKGRPFPGQWGAYGQRHHLRLTLHVGVTWSKLWEDAPTRSVWTDLMARFVQDKASIPQVRPRPHFLPVDMHADSVFVEHVASSLVSCSDFGKESHRLEGQAASSVLYACLAPAAPSPSEEGMYIVDCAVGKESEQARDMELAEQLWLETQKQIRQVRH